MTSEGRFDGADENRHWRYCWLPVWQPTMQIYEGICELFRLAFICHHRKRITIGISGTFTMAIPMVRWVEFWQARTTKRRAQKNDWCATKRGAWSSTGTLSKRHLVMPLGLVHRIRTQALRWRHHEVQRCANEIATVAIWWVCNRTWAFWSYIYDLT